ncbi:MAG: hypothetical protein SF123_05045 [Chloroflexota bacterium]|nr:hypothetical protein [Chloroflexota bacterium]
MIIDASTFFATLGPAGVAVALVVLGLLSRRLGATTRTGAHYGWFFFSAALMTMSAGARVAGMWTSADNLANEPIWVLLYNGLPALAITIAVFTAWHYWSWLLAERS